MHLVVTPEKIVTDRNNIMESTRSRKESNNHNKHSKFLLRSVDYMLIICYYPDDIEHLIAHMFFDRLYGGLAVIVLNHGRFLVYVNLYLIHTLYFPQ